MCNLIYMTMKFPAQTTVHTNAKGTNRMHKESLKKNNGKTIKYAAVPRLNLLWSTSTENLLFLKV